MNLREALQILGPDRVSRGMAAFAATDGGGWQGCLLARCYGDSGDLMRAMLPLAAKHGMVGDGLRPHAAMALEIPVEVVRVIADAFDNSGANLRAECVLFLAESGSATEASVTSHALAESHQ